MKPIRLLLGTIGLTPVQLKGAVIPMTTNEGTHVSDDSISSSEDTGADPIRQLKGETHRKFDKIGNQLAEMQRSQEQLAALLQQAMQPRQAPARRDTQEDFKTTFYSDPEKAAQLIKEQAKREVMEELQTRNAAQAQTQSVVSELASEYPELADPNSDITKKAVDILKKLPAHEQSTTAAYRYAVKQAAEELSVKPRSKRDPDEFMGPSYNPYGAPARRREPSPQRLLADMSPIAEKMGLDLSDPERQKRLVERAKRTNWLEEQAPISTKKRK